MRVEEGKRVAACLRRAHEACADEADALARAQQPDAHDAQLAKRPFEIVAQKL